jgi:integrase
MTIGRRRWKGKNGEWQEAYRVSFKDRKGKTKFRQFDKRKDAQHFENFGIQDYLDELERKEAAKAEEESTFLRPRAPVIAQREPTVGTAGETWLKACEHGLGEHIVVEASTLDAYKNHFERYIKPVLGETLLSDLTPKVCKGFRDHLLASGVNRKYAKKILTSFKQLLNEAIDQEWLTGNPAQRVKVRLSKREHSELVIPQPVEIKQILTLAFESMSDPDRVRRKAYRRFYPMLLLEVTSGLRASELRGLPKDAIRLREHEVKVVQRADKWGTLGPCKSASAYRSITIPQVAVDALQEWLEEAPDGPHGLAFPNWQGNVESLSNITQRLWRPLQKRAGLVDAEGRPRYTFHSLRHFRASALIAAKVNHKRLQVEMGHADIQTTMNVYGHLFKASSDEARKEANAIVREFVSWVGAPAKQIEPPAGFAPAVGADDDDEE